MHRNAAHLQRCSVESLVSFLPMSKSWIKWQLNRAMLFLTLYLCPIHANNWVVSIVSYWLWFVKFPCSFSYQLCPFFSQTNKLGYGVQTKMQCIEVQAHLIHQSSNEKLLFYHNLYLLSIIKFHQCQNPLTPHQNNIAKTWCFSPSYF